MAAEAQTKTDSLKKFGKLLELKVSFERSTTQIKDAVRFLCPRFAKQT